MPKAKVLPPRAKLLVALTTPAATVPVAVRLAAVMFPVTV
jgi:hypothetical protein